MAFEIEYRYFISLARCGERLAIGTKRYRAETLATLKLMQLCAGGEIPEPHGLIYARARHPASVRAEFERYHVPPMARKRLQRGAGGCIPQSYYRIAAARQCFSVGAELHVRHLVRQAVEGADLEATRHVPKFDCRIVPACRQQPPIPTERNGLYRARMSGLNYKLGL